MSRSKPEPPKEDPAVGRLRERQVRDLAELDEEENRRIKAAMAASRGTRAFRRGAGGRGSVTGRGATAPGAGASRTTLSAAQQTQRRQIARAFRGLGPE